MKPVEDAFWFYNGNCLFLKYLQVYCVSISLCICLSMIVVKDFLDNIGEIVKDL